MNGNLNDVLGNVRKLERNRKSVRCQLGHKPKQIINFQQDEAQILVGQFYKWYIFKSESCVSGHLTTETLSLFSSITISSGIRIIITKKK